ncbi:hypothetical protein, partial [Enterococcus faecalis]|uniref:hypothetical protein n=1 Tax=Enterococcus faecalis TaxID=1351 RepID=UPI00287FAAB6
CSKIIHREVLFSVNWLSLTLFYRSDFLFCMDFFIYTKYFTLSYDCNNRAILGIKDALIFDSNLNYLEEDNKRGEPNSLVTFIKKMSSNKIYDTENLNVDLSELFNKAVTEIKIPFNYRRYSRKKNG